MGPLSSPVLLRVWLVEPGARRRSVFGHVVGLRGHVLGLLGHSGGSSPNTRFQIFAETRTATILASALTPVTSPDHRSRLISGLSFITADSIRFASPTFFATLGGRGWL